MYKSISLGLSIVLPLALGCSTPRYRILSAPLISMTVSQVPVGFTIRPGKPIFVQFCENDPVFFETGRWVGMADQAIYKAQKQTRSPVVLDAVIMREDKCVSVEAMSAQITKNAVTTETSKGKRGVAATEIEMPWDKDPVTGEPWFTEAK